MAWSHLRVQKYSRPRLLMAEVSKLQPDAFFVKPVDLMELMTWVKSVA